MKALTICQPYAELIARGEKLVENRTWATRYRGPLAIHAGRGTQWLDKWPGISRDEAAALPRGVVVATCRVVDCVRVEELRQGLLVAEATSPYREATRSVHAVGPWCWLLADVRRLAEPVPAVGRQMLWSLSEADRRLVESRLIAKGGDRCD